MKHVFVLPPLGGAISGGTLYNRHLVAELRARGHAVEVVPRVEDADGFAWVDSLFLPEAHAHWHTRPLGLLAHYLPSLVETPSGLTTDALRTDERAALEHARAVVCPSPWMAEMLRSLGATSVHVAPPALPAEARPSLAAPTGPPRLVLVGAVTPGKGLLPLLRSLAAHPPQAAWTLDVVGSLDATPDYASTCRSAAHGLPVVFHGVLQPHACLASVATAHALVSASVMESYGMAIAEAMACGVPVLARDGGNVRALVERTPAGLVVEDATALADALRRFVDDDAVRARAQHLARTRVPPAPEHPAAVFEALSVGG